MFSCQYKRNARNALDTFFFAPHAYAEICRFVRLVRFHHAIEVINREDSASASVQRKPKPIERLLKHGF